jgi:hypothetical protein
VSGAVASRSHVSGEFRGTIPLLKLTDSGGSGNHQIQMGASASEIFLRIEIQKSSSRGFRNWRISILNPAGEFRPLPDTYRTAFQAC